jgi:hypothetical protein
MVSNMTQGFLPRRRREAAILTQLSANWRGRRAGRNTSQPNLDMANGFGSTNWTALNDTKDDLFEPDDHCFVAQRYEWASVQLPGQEGDFLVRIGCGALMGDQFAVNSFLTMYEKPTTAWNLAVFSILPADDALFFTCHSPLVDQRYAGGMSDLGISKYADDVVKSVVAPKESNLQDLLDATSAVLSSFDEEIEPYGLGQNQKKLVSILSLAGNGSRSAIRDIATGHIKPAFKCTLVTKSLGAMVSHDGSSHHEVACRVRAAQKATFRRGSMWSQEHVPWRLRRIMLLGEVQGSALSGMEAFVLTDRQYASLDTAIVKTARMAMHGKAVKRDANGLVKKGMSNLQVLQHWRIATCATELAVRRLRWLQSMAEFPGDHYQVVAAIVGTCRGELADNIEPGVLDGAITPSATPWAQQAKMDLLRLRELDDGAEIIEDCQGKLFNILKEPDLVERFCQVDVGALRAREWSIGIAPPGFVDDDPLDMPFASDGSLYCGVCKVAFRTKQEFLSHLRQSHNIRSIAYHVTISNQCCCCGAVFSDRLAASKHFARSLSKGKCHGNRTHNLLEISQPSNCDCPVPGCEFTSYNLLHLQLHLTSSHFPWVLVPLIPNRADQHVARPADACLHGQQEARTPSYRRRKKTTKNSERGKWKFVWRRGTRGHRLGNSRALSGGETGCQGGSGLQPVRGVSSSDVRAGGGVACGGQSVLRTHSDEERRRCWPWSCENLPQGHGWHNEDEGFHGRSRIQEGTGGLLESESVPFTSGAQGTDPHLPSTEAQNLQGDGLGRGVRRGGICTFTDQASPIFQDRLGGRNTAGELPSCLQEAGLDNLLRHSSEECQGEETSGGDQGLQALLEDDKSQPALQPCRLLVPENGAEDEPDDFVLDHCQHSDIESLRLSDFFLSALSTTVSVEVFLFAVIANMNMTR